MAALWENTEKLSSFLDKVNEFDAIFYVGGELDKHSRICSKGRLKADSVYSFVVMHSLRF